PIEQDIIQRLQLDREGLSFVNTVLTPTATAYAAVIEKKVGRDGQQHEISRAIEHMQWLGREFWAVPAIKWLQTHGHDHADTVTFFKQLERLAWLQRISGNDPVHHERRFIQLADQITDGYPISELKLLAIEPQMRAETKSNLLSRTLYDKRYCQIVLRRICHELGNDPGPIDGDKVTIEHVLPRKPERDSPWWTTFKTKAGVKNNVHRLGNMTLLSFADNQRAKVQPFPDKRPILLGSEYAISQEAGKAGEWTPAVIEARSTALARRLFEVWSLPF
ncbi:MAG TPA: HNH endonuclease family protein, partial [Hyphomicrobiaceae bacterium]|nr:HNH endonuclease family protein [Hyphomicrobiaceae bacterium]